MLVHSARAFVAALLLGLVLHVHAIQMPAMRRSLSSHADAGAAGGSTLGKLARRWFFNFGGSLAPLDAVPIFEIPKSLIKTHKPAEVTKWEVFLQRVHRKHPDWTHVHWTTDGPVGYKGH
ncbi:uncharacterized protein SRS1_10529 [Sporisorium reilianum f. sp. reilianum]|uniref:Uncharacterized protein n=1 Tax=Sporisorium reilianum f. sp. reilianum TaxID=72559 RepID=A0A2N8U9K1_9BASI|nr:uncharacterized protein SRS1_10529 [Sporisorium reilianum f. sp. reilianum]